MKQLLQIFIWLTAAFMVVAFFFVSTGMIALGAIVLAKGSDLLLTDKNMGALAESVGSIHLQIVTAPLYIVAGLVLLFIGLPLSMALLEALYVRLQAKA